MKPNLLIILNRLVVGGQSIDTVPLAQALADEYNILILYGEKENDELEYTKLIENSKNIQFKKISSLKRNINPVNDLQAIYTIYKIIKSFKPAIVHTHASKPGLVGRLAAWFARVPVVVHTVHGHLFHSYYNKFITSVIISFERMLGRITTKIVALGNEQQRDITEKYKIVPAGKTIQISLGLNEDFYRNNREEKRNAFRKKYELKETDVAVSIIGRMVPIKNHAGFIEVINELKNNYQLSLKFFFIGDGYLKKSLQQKLTEYNISWNENEVASDVYFTSWLTPITDALHAMDIVALTSLNEGTPMSLIEAQLCSIPVVSTNSGGSRDTFINNESGFLVTDFTPESFASNLIKLANNAALRKEMGEKGYQFAKAKFSKQAEIQAFKSLYKNLTA